MRAGPCRSKTWPGASARASPAWPSNSPFWSSWSPALHAAGERLAALGCERVDVVPLFLGAGGHVRKDLPVLLQALKDRHPSVQWQLHQAIGEVDSVIEAMAEAALQTTLAP